LSDDIPQVFSDVFDFAVTPYGVAVTFGLTGRRQPTGKAPVSEDQVVVRMSLEQAKVLAMLLRKNLSQYERENGLEISLPHAVYTTLEIAREDWPLSER
jgi:hypothetical protein